MVIKKVNNKKLRVILADKGKKLFFEKNNMKLEIDKKVDLNDYISFFAETYAELIVAKYNLKNNKAIKVRENARFIIGLN